MCSHHSRTGKLLAKVFFLVRGVHFHRRRTTFYYTLDAQEEAYESESTQFLEKNSSLLNNNFKRFLLLERENHGEWEKSSY